MVIDDKVQRLFNADKAGSAGGNTKIVKYADGCGCILYNTEIARKVLNRMLFQHNGYVTRTTFARLWGGFGVYLRRKDWNPYYVTDDDSVIEWPNDTILEITEKGYVMHHNTSMSEVVRKIREGVI
jgi:hypothetical protein